MIQTLTGKYRKHVAWLLFLVFYGDLAGNLYAGVRTTRTLTRDHRFVTDDLAFSHSLFATGLEAPSAKKIRRDDKYEINRESHDVKSDREPGNKESEQKISGQGEIGGPSQPEMSSFKSVGTDNMVNLFTGDFSYSIPLLDVGGYPVNLFYNAGITMDQEASWVGLGWNINPGTISRNMRGLPDDYNGVDSITKVQAIKPDLTVGVSGAFGGEIAGTPVSANASLGIFYNNRRGLGLEMGVKGEFKAPKSAAMQMRDEKNNLKDTSIGIGANGLSVGFDLNSQNGMTLNAGFFVNRHNIENTIQKGLSTSVGYNSRQGVTDLSVSGEYKKYQVTENEKHEKSLSMTDYWQHSSNISFARSSFTPSIRMPLTTFNQTYTVKLGGEATVVFPNASITGYVQETRLDKDDRVQKKPAYGYMYYEKATDDKNAMLDFNRLNDGVYTLKKPIIDLPVYTYDVFTINGEGTGGSFRGYRGNMGYMRDNYTKSKTGSFSLSLDLGSGAIFHGGTTIGGLYSPSFVNDWQFGNAMRQTARFNTTDSTYQSFYFKNPGEKAIIDPGYYEKMGGDQLIRPYLLNPGTATPLLASGFQVFDSAKNYVRTIPVKASDTYRKTRDKRTQVITYLTAFDAARVGLDTCLYSYIENKFYPGSCRDSQYVTRISRYKYGNPSFYRKAHHISEVDVLEPDGQRYVFGLPAYEITQSEVTFNTENTPTEGSNLVDYAVKVDNSVDNKKGRDGFYQNQTTNGYAHSFLLTGILSPDYVDVTGNGITDDDLGTAIRFDYSRVDKLRSTVPQGNYWLNYKWRMPADSAKATYNEGLKADKRDDKALYTYGVKELWYLHSIESKNMVATFYISDRNDGRQVRNDDGGLAAGPGQKKLDSIKLYTKADFLKFGSNARPLKTVHFLYKYSLCKNFNLNGNPTDGRGKLTLVALWFSYNGNSKQVKNKYVFKYAQTVNSINANPDYNPAENDRWGNYKPHSVNPEGVPNGDYPYTIQHDDPRDTAANNAYASAWNLQRILLPGGAELKVDYEADDYAYVQNRRASQMMKVAGFAYRKTDAPTNQLYTGTTDHPFVFFNVPDEIHSIAELREKYMQDFKELLLKLSVKMPKGNIGADPAWENLVVYAGIKSYGLTANPKQFYVEMSPSHKGGSPVMETIVQFLKDQLPSRAYPGYEVIGDGALKQVVRAVLGMMDGFKKGVIGFENDLKMTNKCKVVDTNLCFGRLNNPYFKKVGGGHRVRRITISDNWDKMTGQFKSDYGQVYDYTTTGYLNGKKITISSGVASYEPGVGNEENPFREILKYYETQFLGPTNYDNVELPVAETFFPSPMVGYSKVTVRSIHHNKDTTKYKSAIGFQQTEFYTTRDFPVISDYTDFDNDSRHHHKPNAIEKIFNFNQRDYMTLTQGFRVVLNDMNGKLKSQTSFAENDSVTPVNYTANYYRIISRGDNKFKLDNVVPVISGSSGVISNKLIGKEVEVMNDFREHFSYTYSGNIPINVEYFQAGPIPVFVPTIFRMIFRDESLYRSATTLKVVNEYGILDSVVNIDKGSVVGTHNLVYDAETGDVLISRTNNEFNKPLYQFNYPAWWVNSGMEPAYRNIDVTYKKVLFRNGKIEESPQVNMKNFESGDEIYLDYPVGAKGPTESLACIQAGYASQLPPTDEYRIWAIDVTKDLRNTTKEFLFVDRHGSPVNALNATIRIIRSGKRNFAGASVGSIISLANPIRTIDGTERVVIDSMSNVINASVAEFKERWRANDMFYAQDTAIVTSVKVPIQTVTIQPVESDGSYSIGYYRPPGINRSRRRQAFANPEFFMARQYDLENNHSDAEQKSWVRFNFDSFSPNSQIVSAKLSLWAHHLYHNMTIQDQAGAGWHSAADPHLSAYRPNDFYLHRVLGAWPANNNDAAWNALYNAQQSGSQNEVWVRGTIAPVENAKDYIQAGNSDKSIDITNMVKAMVRDKYDITKNYSPAIKISLVSRSKKDARICFSTTSDHLSRRPMIEIRYYNCVPDTIFATRTTSPQGSFLSDESSDAVSLPSSDSATCSTVMVLSGCFSVFSKKQMNPYIEGVLGNWRSWKSYVYYGERRETDPTANTNINKDGTIRNFETYWAFNNHDSLKLTRTNNPKWVWNAEITQYNRKGAELENRDPLGRYNMGVYGYQETLPVAVTNNSRLRLSAFDGFEDYSYQDDPCEPGCKPSHRHFNAGVTSSMLIDSLAHTGRYSLRIDSNHVHTVNVTVSANDETADPDIRLKLDSIPLEVVTVTPMGTGLTGEFFNNPTFTSPAVYTHDSRYPWLNINADKHNNCTLRDSLPPGINCVNMSARWSGFIQAPATGVYSLTAFTVDDHTRIYLDLGRNLTTPSYTLYAESMRNNGVFTQSSTPITLQKGLFYPIKVEYQQATGPGFTNLGWKQPGPFQVVPVPRQYLYSLNKQALEDSSTTTDTLYCIKPDTIQAINHSLIDSFSLVPGAKMVASVWIKKDTQSCKCAGYNDVNMYVKNGNTIIGTFAPKERIIEGWQQFETIFTVPGDATSIKVEFHALPATAVFIDDLRFHPFNATMKSFVYDPVTLRLASELDENNYASFYEYNDDGGLIRVKKETRLGIKTITETRSAIQKNITDLQ